MVIKINPRISGGFVHHVMKNSNVAALLNKHSLNEEQAHDLVKTIIISAMKDYEIDINNIINRVKEKSEIPKKNLAHLESQHPTP